MSFHLRPARATAVALGVAATAAATLGAASGSAAERSGSAASPKVAAVIKGLDNPFFQSMAAGIKAQASTQKTPVTVQAATSVTDTTGQADKLNALAGQSFGCYLINPISGTNLVQPLAQISQSHKPVVNIDSPVDAAAAKNAKVKIGTYIGTDNVHAGKLGATQVLKLVPKGSKVALVGGIAGDVTSGARLQGFRLGAGSSLNVVQTVAADWDRQKALTAAGDILRAHPDVKAFFVANDDMGLGVVRAAQTAGRKDVKVVSVDGIKDALTSVQSGGLAATVSQYPYAIGTMGMEACRAAAAGKTLPRNVAAPVLVVTKANAAKALGSFPRPFLPYADPFKA